MTRKELRNAIRSLQEFEILHVKGWGQIQKIGNHYAICGEVDHSDPYTDYCDWSFGWKLSWIVEMIQKELKLD